MKFLTLVSSLAAVAYAAPAEAEAQDALIPQAGVNGEKILPRFSQSRYDTNAGNGCMES
jgi:hypothetical protein